MKTLPETPTPAMIDAAVAFALNVQIHAGYGWSQYMRDLYETMVKAAPDVVGCDRCSYEDDGKCSHYWKNNDTYRVCIHCFCREDIEEKS
jgi:hypothetical protein